MLKKRIIPIQLLDGGRLVKSVRFSGFRDVGNPVTSSRVYNSQTADELVLLDVTREGRDFNKLVSVLSKVAAEVFMPISVGGGVDSLLKAGQLIAEGADKVIINTAYFSQSSLVSEIASVYGRQAIVLSLDVKREGDTWWVYSHFGTQREMSLQDIFSSLDFESVGELLVQSIDCDGEMLGYDIDLYRFCRQYYKGPLVAAGGCGNYQDLADVFFCR
jgi:cyclase